MRARMELNFVVISLIVFLTAIFSMPAMSANAKMMKKAGNVNAGNAGLIAKGKKLFFSSSIGTNGFSCATCHVYSVGTYINLHGMGMVIRSLKNVDRKMAAFNKMHHMHMTLQKKDNMCDKFALKGNGLNKDQLKAMSAYIRSLK